MTRKLKPLAAQEVLREKGIRLFSPEEFRRVFSVTLRAAQEFIKDHRHDLFVKLRNGLYATRTDFPSDLEIANRLYGPSYVSFEYALARYRLIPESVYSITSATTRITREYIVRGKAYEYCRIKKEAYRGYLQEKIGGGVVLIADPEKALADYLYFVDLGIKPLNERLKLRKIKKAAVLGYVSFFSRKSLTRLVKKIL